MIRFEKRDGVVVGLRLRGNSVCEVSVGGLADACNKQLENAERLRVGDCITHVNGVPATLGNTANLLREATGAVEVRFERASLETKEPSKVFEAKARPKPPPPLDPSIVPRAVNSPWSMYKPRFEFLADQVDRFTSESEGACNNSQAPPPPPPPTASRPPPPPPTRKPTASGPPPPPPPRPHPSTPMPGPPPPLECPPSDPAPPENWGPSEHYVWDPDQKWWMCKLCDKVGDDRHGWSNLHLRRMKNLEWEKAMRRPQVQVPAILPDFSGETEIALYKPAQVPLPPRNWGPAEFYEYIAEHNAFKCILCDRYSDDVHPFSERHKKLAAQNCEEVGPTLVQVPRPPTNWGPAEFYKYIAEHDAFKCVLCDRFSDDVHPFSERHKKLAAQKCEDVELRRSSASPTLAQGPLPPSNWGPAEFFKYVADHDAFKCLLCDRFSDDLHPCSQRHKQLVAQISEEGELKRSKEAPAVGNNIQLACPLPQWCDPPEYFKLEVFDKDGRREWKCKLCNKWAGQSRQHVDSVIHKVAAKMARRSGNYKSQLQMPKPVAGSAQIQKTVAGSVQIQKPVAGFDVPRHWNPAQIPSVGFRCTPIAKNIHYECLSRCLETDPAQLGKGRDIADKSLGTYSELKLCRAWRVENPNLWRRYSNEKVEVAEQLRRLKPSMISDPRIRELLKKTLSNLPAQPEKATNETWLLHGTSPDNVLTVLSNGLNEHFSKGMFGCGTYFAEDAGKTDQYVKIDHKFGSEPELHKHLYPDNTHPEKVYYVFLCRVILGCFITTTTGEDNVYAPSTNKRELTCIPEISPPMHYHSLLVELGGKIHRFREFLQFRDARIYPEYLMAYHRVPGSGFPRHWDPAPVPSVGFRCVPIAATNSHYECLSRCLETDPARLKFRGTYSKLKLCRAWRVENPNLWRRYSSEKVQVAEQLRRLNRSLIPDPQIRELLNKALSNLPAQPEKATNETWLLHGVSPDNVLNVLSPDNEHFSKGICGTYFAEDAGKTDQDLKIDHKSGSEPEFHKHLYRDQTHPGNVYYVFLCRVILGCFITTTTGEDNVYASITNKRELTCIPEIFPPMRYHSLLVQLGGKIDRFREFLQFRDARIYPEYLMAYHRV